MTLPKNWIQNIVSNVEREKMLHDERQKFGVGWRHKRRGEIVNWLQKLSQSKFFTFSSYSPVVWVDMPFKVHFGITITRDDIRYSRSIVLTDDLELRGIIASWDDGEALIPCFDEMKVYRLVRDWIESCAKDVDRSHELYRTTANVKVG